MTTRDAHEELKSAGVKPKRSTVIWQPIRLTPPSMQALRDTIAAAYAELAQQLGEGLPLEDASYVIVRELPAGDWGYGGVTQAARRSVTFATAAEASPHPAA